MVVKGENPQEYPSFEEAGMPGLDQDQEGISPPVDEPSSFEHGVTAQEEEQGDSLDDHVAREEKDVFERRHALTDRETPPRLVATDTEVGALDDEKDLLATEAGGDAEALSAEEAAMRIVEE